MCDEKGAADSLVWIDIVWAEGLRVSLAPLPAGVRGPPKAVRLIVQPLAAHNTIFIRSEMIKLC